MLPEKKRQLAWLALIFAAGLTSRFAFSPWNHEWLTFLLLALLYFRLKSLTGKTAFLTGWLFGFGWFISGVPWIYTSLHTFGHVIAPVAFTATVLFSAFLALFPATACYLFSRIRTPGSFASILAFTSSWVLLEWLRSWIFGGFPWLISAYSQTHGPLSAYFAVGGVFMVATLTVMLASLAAECLAQPQKPLLWLSFLLPFIFYPLTWQQAVEPTGEKLQVAVLQGNYNLNIKWDINHLAEQLDWYSGQSMRLAETDLIIMPETALPELETQLMPLLAELDEWGKMQQTAIVTGFIGLDQHPTRYYNSLMGLGLAQGIYHKKHLVPLGEYFPMRDLLKLLPGLDIPMDDLTAGDEQQTGIHLQKHKLGVSICYEDTFGDELREDGANSSLLVNASNDAWFGDTAPWQHLQMAQVRAMEFSRYMVRATNTGVSAIIDHRGELIRSSNMNTREILQGTVELRKGSTLYARFGDAASVLFNVTVLILTWRRKSHHAKDCCSG